MKIAFDKVKIVGYCFYLVTQLCPTLLRLHGLYPARLLCPWDFPGKNNGVGCCFLLQGKNPFSLKVLISEYVVSHTHTKKQKERHSKCNYSYRLKQRRYPRLSQCVQSNFSYAWKAENFLLLESGRLAEENFGEMSLSSRSQRFRTGELVPLVITLKAVGTMIQEIEETEIEPQMASSEAAAASTPQSWILPQWREQTSLTEPLTLACCQWELKSQPSPVELSNSRSFKKSELILCQGSDRKLMQCRTEWIDSF